MTDPMRPLRWFREFGRPPRILGLDIARGLAIIGMAGAHIGETPTFDWTDIATWTDLVHGRSSILFAVLAGVSIALMTGRSALPDRERIPGIRLQLIGRGAVIFVIGLGLEMLNTPIAVILTLYGLLYVAVIPFLRWRPWQLLIAAAVLALVGPALLALLGAVTLHPYGAGVIFVLYGSYPITAWMAFVLGGMALGRLHVERVSTAAVALGAGVVLAVSGYGLGAVGQAAGLGGSADAGTGASFSGWDSYPQALAATDPLGSALDAIFAVDPHSGGTAEIIGSGGFALAVIALCVLLSRPLRWPLLPFGALGSMPLTAYTAHVIVIVLVSGPAGFVTSNAFWGVMIVGLLVATTLWSMCIGRGPLERLVGAGAKAMASVPKPMSAPGPRLDP
ncbi:heparan-alpha-glucosaminide N-acetyltransferase domain-containing protein [Microbacterium oxydans]|nr:heparan-alpha-glucosaminide N-acetyltransferase domain-containing protein [Microbacterium oxydans]